ncbi:MAG TPA: RsmB/NOP family class I SAM-dependent RNA methyltransferase [Candidatus Desulfaltia sp.]|nr:RsmB/NOP family class I SAM-dependent RNA methyltransferase [Candidatus Desulfaltia sp.]
MRGREFFLERYSRMGRSLTGDEVAPQAIRVNPLRAEGGEVVEALTDNGVALKKIPYLDHGYVVEHTEFSLGATLEYLLGLYSLQEAASQLPVQALAPGPEDTTLDMCSAPGGKTTQMAAYMMNEGVLYAVDASRDRLYAVENSLERCGVTNCLVYHGDAERIELGAVFTKILLDAPCSGNYVTDPEWFSRRSLRDVEANAERQRRLLSRAVGLLERGGRLLYSTCSLEPEENELNVQWLLENHPVDLEPMAGPGTPAATEVFGVELDPKLSLCRRLWPGDGTQGFFMAEAVKL